MMGFVLNKISCLSFKNNWVLTEKCFVIVKEFSREERESGKMSPTFFVFQYFFGKGYQKNSVKI